VVHAPVPLNVMFVPTPFTTSRPVRAAVTPSANRMRNDFEPPPRPSTLLICAKPPQMSAVCALAARIVIRQ